MFRGTFHHNIDNKGRTSLPVRFRDLLLKQPEASLVITRHFVDSCLVSYPVTEWERIEGVLHERQSIFNRKISKLIRWFVGSAQECQVDRLGRILIPPSLRDVAGSEGEVTWVGCIQHIELWSRERFEAEFSDISMIHQAIVSDGKDLEPRDREIIEEFEKLALDLPI